MVSWTVKSIVECNLCNQWIHSRDNYDCVRHYGTVDVNGMENVFLYRKCMVKLITMRKNIFNDTKVDRIIILLNPLNINNDFVSERNHIGKLKFVLSDRISENGIVSV